MAGTSFPSPGKCVFCGNADRPRTREHIIPKAIAGGPDGLVFTDATCEVCQKRINVIDNHSHLSHLISARRFLDLRGYTKLKDQKPHLRIMAKTAGHERMMLVAAEDYPAVLNFPVYGPTSWQADVEAPLSEPPVAELRAKVLRNDDGRLRRNYGIETFIVGVFGAGLLGRYLGKIAHCYTIARYGIDNVVPFLGHHLLHPDLNDRGILPFIGPSEQRGEDVGLHRIGVFEIERDGYHLVGGVVQLFAKADMPTYEVLVGAMKGSKLPPWAPRFMEPK